MKKILLTLSATIMSIGAFAQITVTSGDIVDLYDEFDNGRDTVMAGMTVGSPGANQTYNFSALVSHGTSHLIFTNPVWTDSGATHFPNSTLALLSIDPTLDTNIVYLTKTAQGLWLDGLVGDIGAGMMVLKNNDPELMVGLDLNYLDTYTDDAFIEVTTTGAAVGQPTFDSVRVRQHHDREYNVDGWGSLTTPLGTFDVLRQHAVDYQKDTAWGYINGFGWNQLYTQEDSSFSYQYWSNDPAAGFPLVEVTVDHNDVVEEANWLMTNPTATGIKENNFDMSIFPNPVQNSLKVNTSVIADKLTITDITGKVVMTRQRFNSGYINTSELNSGVYFISISAGNKIKTQKFVKQ